MALAPTSRFQLLWRLLRSEGTRALFERWLDRRADARRARRFRPIANVPADAVTEVAAPTLWVLPFPLQRRQGGAAIQLLVRLEELAAGSPIALLQRLPDRWRCEIWGQGVGRATAREWRDAALTPRLLDRDPLSVVLEAARWVQASRVHFESLVELPLSLAREVRGAGFEIGISAHDFALFCPRPHLLEEPAGRFCGFSTDRERCASCLAATWDLPAGYQEARRSEAVELLAAASAVEFPSEYMRREHLRLFPAARLDRSLVLPPKSLAGERSRCARSASRPPRRIAFAGAVHRHKGAGALFAAVRLVEERSPGVVEWHVFGGGDPAMLCELRSLPRTRVHGYYRAGSLAARLAAARIDLVLLPSVWPEAHCLVLDECLTATVPVVAFDLGALGDRLRGQSWGTLVDPATGADGLAAAICRLL